MTNEEKLDNSFLQLTSIIKKMQSYSNENIDEASITQTNIISFLCANEEKDIYQRDIEKEFSMRRSTVSGTLKEMQANGLVTRSSVSTDARLKKVTPTEKGKTINEFNHKNSTVFTKKIANEISNEDVDKFCEIVSEIKSILS